MKRVGWLVASVVLGIGAGAAVSFAQDPLEVGPDVYSKLFENERVRVMEVRFKPGESIGMHSHPDHLAYMLSGGLLQLSHPDGTLKDIAGDTGQVFWIPAESHAAVNTGTTEVRILVVELKP